MVVEYVLFVIGIIFLIKGADFIVEGSSSLAKKMRVSPLVIGLTIVAFGTSLPELAVNIISAVKGVGDIALGNIIGSNIANILLILGVAAIINPIKVKNSTVWKEIPFSFLAAVVLFVFSSYQLIDGIEITHLTRVSGIVMLCFFAIFIYYTVGLANKKEKIKGVPKVKHSNLKIFFFILLGLVGLYLGGKWTVDGAVFVARMAGLSNFLISATVIAIGTSLPELATAITAAKRKETDLLIGNSIGSNVFNIFWILGITSVIAPLIVSGITLDLIILMVVSFLVFLALFVGRKHEIERWQGVMFIVLYVAYLIFLVMRG